MKSGKLKHDPPVEIRQDRHQGNLLPGLRGSVEVEHERVEVVRDIADAQVDVVLHTARLELLLVT